MLIRPIYICCFFAIALSASVAIGQIVENPEFENSTNSWEPYGPAQREIVTPGYQSSEACKVSERKLYWHGVTQNITGKLTPDTDYHVQVWVKTQASDQGALRIEVRQIDDRGETYITVGEVMAVSDEWRLLEGGFRYQENGTVTTLQVTINGTNLDASLHNFIVDAVSITENDWKAAANVRIEQFRKRDVKLNFADSNGSSVSDLQIDIQQVGHHFGFGSTMNWVVSTNPVYANFFQEHFEWATVEWHTQWKPTETVRGTEDYTDAEFAAMFAKQNGINLRGHALAWANPEFLPEWLPGLSAAETGMELTERIHNATSRFEGAFHHWDVNNEMLDYSFFADRLGSSIRPWIFQQARQGDADVSLFTNEFGIHQSALKASRYRQMILDLEADGAEVNGIGLQSHFFQGNTSAKGLEISLRQLVDLDKQIWATEFDVVNPDPVERSKCLEDFYRYMFSRPEIDGIIMWGFWAGSHWMGPDASLVDNDWTVNEAGQAYFDLMDEWETSETAEIVDQDYDVEFRGFLGRYLVTVTDPTTGVSNWHLINIVPDSTGAIQELTIVPNTIQNSLTVYGTEADDDFELDFSSPGVFKLNGSRQFVSIWDSVSNLRFEGLGGNDLLTIHNEAVETRYQIYPDRTRNRDTQFEFGYSNIEDIQFFSAHADDYAHFYDSRDDDHFLSHPEYSRMTTESGIKLTVSNYSLVVARAGGGDDTAEIYDSVGVDFAYTNVDYMRIYDGTSTRRADNFDTNHLFSTNANDRIVYDVPANTTAMSLGDGLNSIAVNGRSFEFSGFWYSLMSVDPQNQTVVGLNDSDGNDVLRISENSLELFSPGYRLRASGITAARVSEDAGGHDVLILQDSSGDDSLNATDDTVTLDGENHDFSVAGYDDVRLFGNNGGVNSTSVSAPTFLLRLFGSWD